MILPENPRCGAETGHPPSKTALLEPIMKNASRCCPKTEAFPHIVMPAVVGVQDKQSLLASRFRGNDAEWRFWDIPSLLAATRAARDSVPSIRGIAVLLFLEQVKKFLFPFLPLLYLFFT